MLTNKSVIKPDEFTSAANGRVYLNDAARRRFLSYFEQRISTQIAHPDVQNLVTYRRAIQLQVRRYKRSLLQAEPYQPFLRAV
ncbi:MAG: hypothetical protein LH647_11285 [Leptolyngbyaceae cyanobacterium CAN_BIN12]|nr:hypothetical protein [Leptolyngbyaceae cyanobacterium CAN_BIN12]